MHTRVTEREANVRQSHPPSVEGCCTRALVRVRLYQRVRSLVGGARHTVARRFDRPLHSLRSVPCLPPPFPPKASSTTLPATPIRRFASLPPFLYAAAALATPLQRLAARLFFLPCSASQTPFTRVRARSARGGVASPPHRQRRETGVVLLEREQNATTTTTRREKRNCCCCCWCCCCWCCCCC